MTILRKSGEAGRQPWSLAELATAAFVCLLLLVPVTSRVGYSGAWDGDPAAHNRLVVDAVNTFVDEYAKGGDPLRGFLQCYYLFPKMLHEILLAVFILVIHGLKHVSFGDIELYGAWFATLWTLGGFVVLYGFLRLFFSRMESLLILPVVGLSGYILMYANFARQNMPSHVLSWLALLVYFRSRVDRGSSANISVLVAGILYGASVAMHYSATYTFFAFLGVEMVLVWWRRRLIEPAVALGICIAGATAVWFLVDLFYYVYANRYPADANYFGQNLSDHHSFLEGMIRTNDNLVQRVAAFKLEDRKWWFLPGFIYRCLGPVGSALTFLGVCCVPSLWKHELGEEMQFHRSRVAVLGAILAVSVLVSLEYFQNARKLMPFYPVWCVFLGYGLFSASRFVSAQVSRFRAGTRGASLGGRDGRSRAVLAIAAALVVVHFIIFSSALFQVYKCRRDAGYMGAYLADHGIARILVDPIVLEAQMAPEQADIKNLTVEQADGFDYIVLHRLISKIYTADVMNGLRHVEPVVSFQNQAATPLFWYEFPLKKSFMDFSDRETNERSLYRWKDVRGILSQFCRRTK